MVRVSVRRRPQADRVRRPGFGQPRLPQFIQRFDDVGGQCQLSRGHLGDMGVGELRLQFPQPDQPLGPAGGGALARVQGRQRRPNPGPVRTERRGVNQTAGRHRRVSLLAEVFPHDPPERIDVAVDRRPTPVPAGDAEPERPVGRAAPVAGD